MPRIEFPCQYQIQVIMVCEMELRESQVEAVLDTVHAHAAPVDRDRLRLNPSRNGNYVSLRLELVATGEPQLKALHQSLLQLPYVKLVL